jgi:preprotein translocase subunit SecE
MVMTKKKKAEDRTESRKSLGTSLVEFREFFDVSKKELKKVVWPDRKEMVGTCGAVLVLVAVISVFLGTMDFALAKIIRALLS